MAVAEIEKRDEEIHVSDSNQICFLVKTMITTVRFQFNDYVILLSLCILNCTLCQFRSCSV